VSFIWGEPRGDQEGKTFAKAERANVFNAKVVPGKVELFVNQPGTMGRERCILFELEKRSGRCHVTTKENWNRTFQGIFTGGVVEVRENQCRDITKG